MKISVVIITFNEERNIREAIDSAKWADEVLIVDSFSEDLTVVLAETAGAKIIQRKWRGFAEQKQFAAAAAAHDWILSIDADERISDELSSEIRDLRETNNSGGADGYTIPRLSVYMGRKIKHSGWYPDRQLRLFDRRKGRWRQRVIHESIEITPGSKVGKLSGHLLHYSITSASEHSKLITERYAPLSAQQMLIDGRKTSRTKAGAAGIVTFFRTYILKAGLLDGFPGFCIAYFAAYNSFLKHLMLLELLEKQSDT